MRITAYTTLGEQSGTCGHRHRDALGASKCVSATRKWDRRVVGVAPSGTLIHLSTGQVLMPASEFKAARKAS